MADDKDLTIRTYAPLEYACSGLLESRKIAVLARLESWARRCCIWRRQRVGRTSTSRTCTPLGSLLCGLLARGPWPLPSCLLHYERASIAPSLARSFCFRCIDEQEVLLDRHSRLRAFQSLGILILALHYTFRERGPARYSFADPTSWVVEVVLLSRARESVRCER